MDLRASPADDHPLNASACEGEVVLTTDRPGTGRSVCTALTPAAALETAARLIEAAQSAVKYGLASEAGARA
jgi:hypothetical protein